MTQHIQALIQLVLAILVLVSAWSYGMAYVPAPASMEVAGRFATGRVLLWMGERVHPLARAATVCVIVLPGVFSFMWLCGRSLGEILLIT